MPSDVCVLLGSKIRELRKARGWRQIDLAQHAGIHEVHISNLERGVREIGLRNLVTLAQALKVPVTDLVVGLEINNTEADRSRTVRRTVRPKS